MILTPNANYVFSDLNSLQGLLTIPNKALKGHRTNSEIFRRCITNFINLDQCIINSCIQLIFCLQSQ